jgi:hypothetical protein
MTERNHFAGKLGPVRRAATFAALFLFWSLAGAPAAPAFAQNAAPPKEPSPPASPAPNAAAIRPQLRAWSKTMQQSLPPGPGCYTASYPGNGWKQIPCGPPPQHHRPSQARPIDFGYPDYMLQPSSTASILTSATGVLYDFFGAAGETVQQNPSKPNPNNGRSNVYSLQINTDQETAPCPGNSSSSCVIWEQFIFKNNDVTNGGTSNVTNGTYIMIEYVLPNYVDGTTHTACPTVAAWFEGSGGDTSCYLQSNTAQVPLQTTPDGSSIQLSGTITGASDAVSFLTSDGQMIAETVSSTPAAGQVARPFALQSWNQVQFNLFGDGNGDQAVFKAGATMGVQVSVLPDTTALQPCFNNSLTAETANLRAGSKCVVNSDGILFSQGVPPTVTGISPTNGPGAGRTTIAITGAGFSKNILVAFADTSLPAPPVVEGTCDTSTHCTAVTPAGPAAGGGADVLVANLTPNAHLPGAYTSVVAAARFNYAAVPPNCNETLICPKYTGTPAQIQYSCNVPVAFYESTTGDTSSATPVPNATPTSYIGIDETADPEYLFACWAGGKTGCQAFLEYLSATNCHALPPPPPKPLKNCEECFQTGRQCKRIAGGYECTGLPQ